MKHPTKRDEPVSQVSLAVLRTAMGGQFKHDWESTVTVQTFPSGTELRTFYGPRRFEATLVNSRITRKLMHMVDVRVGAIAHELLHEVPSLTKPIERVPLDFVDIAPNGTGANFVTARIEDQRLFDEQERVTDILSSYVGDKFDWPDHPIEMNFGFLPQYFDVRSIKRAQGIMGSILPNVVDFRSATILPRN